VFLIRPSSKISAEAHGDGTRYDLSEPCRHNDFAAERQAASANGTVKPSAMPMTTSRTDADSVKCLSTCGVAGMALSFSA
jgi:hypothetical protein